MPRLNNSSLRNLKFDISIIALTLEVTPFSGLNDDLISLRRLNPMNLKSLIYQPPVSPVRTHSPLLNTISISLIKSKFFTDKCFIILN